MIRQAEERAHAKCQFSLYLARLGAVDLRRATC